jgi:plastocyanin
MVVLVLAACSGPAQNARPAEPAEQGPRAERVEYKAGSDKPASAPTPAGPATPAPTGKLGPVGERAQELREAADLLDKAQNALDTGNRNLADRLFSTAELLTGPEPLALIAPRFREGAPPRITTPTQKVDPGAAPQPRVSGSSEAEDEKDRVPPPRVEGSLAGTMQVDGRPMTGAFGLITLEPESGKWKPRTPKRLVVEQRNREFLPHVMAVSVGSTVSFPNFDAVFHNVFSTSPVGAFDLGIYKVGEAREVTFPKEGIVRLGCNLHANMSAYIAVVAAPAYVVTDDTGKFSFRHLPPGKYKLKAWSERSKAPVSLDVAVKAGRNALTVDVSGDAAQGPQPDKFGGKRG